MVQQDTMFAKEIWLEIGLWADLLAYVYNLDV